jgi:hypothetical protein
MVFEKQYYLNLENPKAVLSGLKRITECHSYGTGVVFSSSLSRKDYGQFPLNVKQLDFYANSREEIDLKHLINIVKYHLEPVVLVYRSRKNKEKYFSFFLPESINGDPSFRILRSGSINNSFNF